MQPLGELVPTKDPDAEKRGFKEKCHQGFNRQRSAEDIPHKT